MSVARCPCCGQPMRMLRAGVYLPVVKAAIFDAVAERQHGVTTDQLRRLEVWRDRRPPQAVGIRTHVWQINEYLDETAWRIGRKDGRWVLMKRREAMTLREARQ